MSTEVPCPICLEFNSDLPIRDIATIEGCGHEFCKPCIEHWILRLESASSDPDPNCPECRCPLVEKDIIAILGRPLRRVPPQMRTDELYEADGDYGVGEEEADRRYEPDEFTRAYLVGLEREGSARRCPSCRAWVMLAEGCNNVMCRCGCKFCFCCGQRGSCVGYTFFNNISGVEDHRDRWIGRNNYQEEAERCVIDPLFEGYFWDAIEEDAGPIDPLFEGEVWIPIETEDADPGVVRFLEVWAEAMEPDPWDGDDGLGAFGAFLFG